MNHKNGGKYLKAKVLLTQLAQPAPARKQAYRQLAGLGYRWNPQAKEWNIWNHSAPANGKW